MHAGNSFFTAALVVAAVLCEPAAAGTTRAPARPAASDSVTVRAMFRWEGSNLEPCRLPEDWGWDSLTCRLARRGAFPPNGWTPYFAVTRILSKDSAWVAFSGVPHGSRLSSRGFIVPESLLVSRTWSETFGTQVMDAEGWFRVRLVDPWPEPVRAPLKTARLVGRVEDDSTGCALFWSRLTIDGTKLGAFTDTLGHFEIADVPVGKISLNACATGYSWKHLELVVPDSALSLRLRRQPGVPRWVPPRCH